jgi:hypothetical protein
MTNLKVLLVLLPVRWGELFRWKIIDRGRSTP